MRKAKNTSQPTIRSSSSNTWITIAFSKPNLHSTHTTIAMRLWIKTWRYFFFSFFFVLFSLFSFLEANVHDRYVFILHFCNQVPSLSARVWENVMCKCVFLYSILYIFLYLYYDEKSHRIPARLKIWNVFCVVYSLCNLFILLFAAFFLLSFFGYFFFLLLYSKIVSYFCSSENLSMSLDNTVSCMYVLLYAWFWKKEKWAIYFKRNEFDFFLYYCWRRNT